MTQLTPPQGSSQASNIKVSWDYTTHAQHYDKRADYSQEAINNLVALTSCAPWRPVADIGAGTGKLTKELLQRGLTVKSVEPNEAMRSFGIKNTSAQSVSWSAGTGEATNLQTSSVYGAFFGSSFNVVDQKKALNEVCRILVPNGWFACMWNHRDLEDPIQKSIEEIIRSNIVGYSYGLRREDPTSVIESSNCFSDVKTIDGRFYWEMTRDDIIVAWKSHATLRRQTGSDSAFDKIIAEINSYLSSLKEPISVPYTTRIYYAQMIKEKSDLNAALYSMAD
jgi:ubiquinone/menaquinone biosynthesis C-methylase UbiE